MAQLPVAFLGPDASYSHAAARLAFSGFAPSPQKNFHDVLAAVVDEGAAGVLPIENSTTGRVAPAQAALWPLEHAITGKLTLPIRHCLIGGIAFDEARARQGEGLTIRSHPQGLAQCRQFLADHLPLATLEEAQSTSFGVAYIADGGGDEDLAIGSRFAADFYGQPVMRDTINDAGENSTSFYALGPSGAAKPGGRVGVIALQTDEAIEALTARLCQAGYDICAFHAEPDDGGGHRVHLELAAARDWLVPASGWMERCAALFPDQKWRWQGGYDDHRLSDG